MWRSSLGADNSAGVNGGRFARENSSRHKVRDCCSDTTRHSINPAVVSIHECLVTFSHVFIN